MKTFNAITIRKSILPEGRKVELSDTGGGHYLIVKAETDTGAMKSTEPFTLFLRSEDFRRLGGTPFRTLGSKQLHFLECVYNTGDYYDGCGWMWKNRSTSRLLAESLERRGLLHRDIFALTGEPKWSVTPKGLQMLVAGL